jgi:Tol biopolymer transport system component
MVRKRHVLLAALVGLALAVAGWRMLFPPASLPSGLAGGIVFVSDRDGIPTLYWRQLPGDDERRLTFGSEGVDEPAVSPDGARVAFSMNGRIGVVALGSGETRILTLAVDWRDAQPAWLPDGRRLVVSARHRTGEAAGLAVLDPPEAGPVERHPLTVPREGDDTSPAASPDGSWVVFVRENHLMRVDLADGRVRRLTGGFKQERSPRFLPSGQLVCAWSEGKAHGIDVIDPSANTRETLVDGDAYYRTVAPSRDGRFLAATFSWDLSLRPLATLVGGRPEEIRLLDASGHRVATLESSWRHTSHSPDWGH